MTPRRGLDLGTIVETAAHIADSEGEEQLSLAHLAKTLGVRSPSLYNHVNGLPELKAHLIRYGLKKLGDLIEETVQGREGDEAIIAIAAAYLAFVKERPGLYALTLRPLDEADEVQRKLGADIVAKLVKTLAPYRLSEEEAIHAVRGLRSILHGFASLEQYGSFGMPVSVNESFQFVLGLYLKGLGDQKER